MIGGNDIVVLVRLLAESGDWTFRSLGAELGMDPAALHRSTAKLERAGLLDEDHRPIRANGEEFLLHGLRYVVPPELRNAGRGVPTAWGAMPLADHFGESAEPSPVWPDPAGTVRGPLLDPITGAVPSLAASNPKLGEWFALLDGLRVGRARERGLAAEMLSERIWSEQPAEA